MLVLCQALEAGDKLSLSADGIAKPPAFLGEIERKYVAV